MKLQKSSNNVVISGVLGGVGEYLHVDPTIVRILFILLFFANIPFVLPLYVIGAVLLPKEVREDQNIDKSPKNTHTRDDMSKITEDDWSDF